MNLLEELPEPVFRDILLRVSYKSHSKIKQLLKPAKEIMEFFQFYEDRIKFGTSQKYICLLQPAGISLYDPFDQSCEMLPPIPTGFEIILISQILCVNHKLVLLGLKYYGTFTTKILIYDLLSSKWQQGAEIPTARSQSVFACCASPEGSIYIAGGLRQDSFDDGLREAAVYKVDEDKWELLPQMNQEIGMCRGVLIEGMFYVIGVFNNRSQRFDPNTGVWTSIENISLANTWYVHILYVFGQLIAFGNNGIEQYNWEENVWRKLEASARDFTFVHPAVWCDGLFLCGYNNPSILSGPPVFYMYKPGAALSQRWISVDKPKFFLEIEVVAMTTVEI